MQMKVIDTRVNVEVDGNRYLVSHDSFQELCRLQREIDRLESLTNKKSVHRLEIVQDHPFHDFIQQTVRMHELNVESILANAEAR